MTTNSQQQSVALAQADQAAQRDFEQQSVDSPVAPCPAKQREIYILPARYALAEDPADHQCLRPGVQTQSHPVALRGLRPGYLYLWHGDGPLKRYGIAEDGLLQEQGLADPKKELKQGSQAGLILEKKFSAWLMYSEIPLLAATCEQLSNSAAERSKRMRMVHLPEIAVSLEATHCPRLDDAEQVVAELMPQVRDRALAQDYHQNAAVYRAGVDGLGQQIKTDPSPANVQAYVDASIWLHEREEASYRHPEAGEFPPGYWSSVPWDVAVTDKWLAKAKSEAAGLHAVFVANGDVLGMLRDLDSEHQEVSKKQDEWDQANALKGLMAGFINSLISEDGAELSSMINYRYRERDIQLTPDQGEVLLQAQRDIKPLIDEETRINRDVRRTHGHREADTQLASVHARQQIILEPVRSFIPPDLHGHVQGVVLDYRATKARNVTEERSGAQVAKRVRVDAMNEWVASVAETHRAWVASRREPLFNDAKTLLAHHHEGSWFVDYDTPEHCSWLSEVALNTLGELCTAGPGVVVATNLLRAPTPNKPLSLLATGFTPELALWVEAADRLTAIEAALTADNSEMVGSILKQVASNEKFAWLHGLGGSDGSDWGSAVSRLSAAFVELEAEHLKGTSAAPVAIQQFPKSLLSLMVVLKTSANMALTVGKQSYRLSGPLGSTVWDWSRETSQRLRSGLTPLMHQADALKAYGGAISLVALLIHGINLTSLRARDAHRENDGVRRAEHLAVSLNAAAALSAVIQNAAVARKAVELTRHGIRLPLVTLLGTFTGSFALLAGLFDLYALAKEQQKEDAYWTADEWGRLTRTSAQVALAGTYAGLGGYATAMVLMNRMTAARATVWFTRASTPVGWATLVVEGLYLAWRHYAHVSDMQRFLEQSCWGNQRRWGDSEAEQATEFQALIDMLFRPQLGVATRYSLRQLKILRIVPTPYPELYRITTGLDLVLPGA
ncbi:toxin VasX, partial [Pseudomonas sp.]|uniref:toxin VasX n=1 Tax=Pseudomonas sp. TaxID=306 RepID=UPI00272A939A